MEFNKTTFDNLFVQAIANIQAMATQYMAKSEREKDGIQSDYEKLIDRCNDNNLHFHQRAVALINLIFVLNIKGFEGNIFSENNAKFFKENNFKKDNIDSELEVLKHWRDFINPDLTPKRILVVSYLSILVKCDRLSRAKDIHFLIKLIEQKEIVEA